MFAAHLTYSHSWASATVANCCSPVRPIYRFELLFTDREQKFELQSGYAVVSLSEPIQRHKPFQVTPKA